MRLDRFGSDDVRLDLDWTRIGFGLDWTGLGFIFGYGLDWIGLDWVGWVWVGLDRIGGDWVGDHLKMVEHLFCCRVVPSRAYGCLACNARVDLRLN